MPRNPTRVSSGRSCRAGSTMASPARRTGTSVTRRAGTSAAARAMGVSISTRRSSRSSSAFASTSADRAPAWRLKEWGGVLTPRSRARCWPARAPRMTTGGRAGTRAPYWLDRRPVPDHEPLGVLIPRPLDDGAVALEGSSGRGPEGFALVVDADSLALVVDEEVGLDDPLDVGSAVTPTIWNGTTSPFVNVTALEPK